MFKLLNFLKNDTNIGRIKKTVGKEKPESPLERAFRFKLMLEELRGKRLQEYENIRRIVGRSESQSSEIYFGRWIKYPCRY
jgi:hypothetical protein